MCAFSGALSQPPAQLEDNLQTRTDIPSKRERDGFRVNYKKTFDEWKSKGDSMQPVGPKAPMTAASDACMAGESSPASAAERCSC